MMLLLWVLFTAIPAVEEHRDADNTLFEGGLATFLNPRKQSHEIFLGRVPHEVSRRVTEKKIAGRYIRLLHDKKLLKSIVRIWFKKLQEHTVYDLFSHNFVLLDSNFSDDEKNDVHMRIRTARKFSRALIDHYTRELSGSGWEVSVVPGTHKTGVIDTAEHIMNATSAHERKKLIAVTQYRKRPGSIAHTIVREKFVLACTKDGQTRYTEVCVYPFERVDVEGAVFKGSGLIGFVGKLLDDQSGEYAMNRLIMPDPEDLTGPPPIEFWAPPVWNKSRFDTIKLWQHRPKPKRKK